MFVYPKFEVILGLRDECPSGCALYCCMTVRETREGKAKRQRTFMLNRSAVKFKFKNQTKLTEPVMSHEEGEP